MPGGSFRALLGDRNGGNKNRQGAVYSMYWRKKGDCCCSAHSLCELEREREKRVFIEHFWFLSPPFSSFSAHFFRPLCLLQIAVFILRLPRSRIFVCLFTGFMFMFCLVLICFVLLALSKSMFVCLFLWLIAHSILSPSNIPLNPLIHS